VEGERLTGTRKQDLTGRNSIHRMETMTNGGEKIEFENDRVRVVRVKLGTHEKRPLRTRNDRVLIWLTDAHHTRTDPKGRKEEIRRWAGEVAWRTASQHEIENLAEKNAEMIIVELKK
jgi:hypothetical protein